MELKVICREKIVQDSQDNLEKQQLNGEARQPGNERFILNNFLKLRINQNNNEKRIWNKIELTQIPYDDERSYYDVLFWRTE